MRYFGVCVTIDLPPGPAFHGPRFDEGSFPLDCLEELIAYRNLVRVAADEWATRQELPIAHPSRDVAVAVSAFERKCCRPTLKATKASDGELVPLAPVRVWIEHANEALARTIRGEFDSVSEPLLRAVSGIGTKLRKDDWINLDGSESRGSAAVYTPETRERVREYLRKQLVPDRRTLVGIVVGAKDRSTSREIDVLTLDGQRISGAVDSAEQHRTAWEAYAFKKEDRPLIRVVVVGLFVGPTAKKVDRFEQVLALSGPELMSRMSDIESLNDGWDGEGAPRIPFARTEEARRVLTRVLATVDRTPAIAPGPNGELVLEWSLRKDPRLSLGMLLDDEPGFWLYDIGGEGTGRRVDDPGEFIDLWATVSSR